MDVLCIGSALWDVVGRTPQVMAPGDDRPGVISRLPGGVALNIAMALAGLGKRTDVCSVVGEDAEGVSLLSRIEEMGVGTAFMLVHPHLSTDRYMAIEDPTGLVAALADAGSLEAAGADVLAPLDRLDGWCGPVVVDGNLTEDVLALIARHPALAGCDLRFVPASPGKALRLRGLSGTVYVNREEAELICAQPFADAKAAAQAVVALGFSRALVTDGGAMAADAGGGALYTAVPPQVDVQRVTGAGDNFLAGHIAAELDGCDRPAALTHALEVAARHISIEVTSCN